MNSIARSIFSLPSVALRPPSFELQQWRGIRVKVRYGNLEQALAFMQNKMRSSGVERLIKQEQRHHIKNSEKRVLARKRLEVTIRSKELARKLKSILIKKVRVNDLILPSVATASGPPSETDQKLEKGPMRAEIKAVTLLFGFLRKGLAI